VCLALSQVAHIRVSHSEPMDTWGLRGTLAAAAVATVIAGAGGAAVYAATGGGFATTGGHGGPPPGFPPPQAMQDGGHDATKPVHGESVVANGTGGFTVELVQSGTITAIDTGSVTARSADGFTQRYVIPATATTPPFKVGDEVTIRATRQGAHATVTSLR
jgi:hypothetical protein